MIRWATVTAAFAAIAASSGVASAQTVDVSADSRSIYAGLAFPLLVEASGFEEDPEPPAPEFAIKGAKVTFVGSSPRVVRSTSIVNGRRTDRVEVTFTYRYQITPSKAGTYRIPAIEVVQRGRKASSKPRTFAAKSVKGTDSMAIRMVLPERPVWLGETFEVAIDWFLATDPSRPSFGIPLFAADDWVTVKAAETANRRRQVIAFPAGAEELELPYSQERVELDGQPFTRLRFKALVTPTKAGTLELDPARVVSGLEVGMTRDRFGFPTAKTEIFEAVDSKRQLVIKPLPQTGRPAGFKNAVGTGFSIEVQASRTVVRVGDPIELTVTVRSDVRLAGMALPPLSVLLDPNHFEVGDEEPVGTLSEEGRKKVFTVTAQLKSSDAREVPPLELAYFNPKVGAYETARSQPIALQVAGSSMVGAAQVSRGSATTTGGDSKSNVSLVGADLALSNVAKTMSTPTEVKSLSPLLLALYVIPVVVFCFMVWRRRTEEGRKETGARKKRVSAFDSAVASAASAPAKTAAADLASALRSMKKNAGEAPDDFDSVLAELDAEAYNPRGGKAPLDRNLIDRCVELGRHFTKAAVLFIAITLGASAASASTLDQGRVTYQEAISAENPEDAARLFARAASDFAAEAEANQGRPELLVDWGNASLGARELGWAVLAYRRALAIDRGNKRARGNLAWVRSRLPEWAPKPDESGALASLFFWHSDWSLARRHLVAAFAFAIAVLLVVPWRRRRPVWAISVSAGLFVVVAAMLISVLAEPDRSRDAVLVRDAEVLRAADSPGAGAVLASPLPAGLEVIIVETRSAWHQVELADGKRGWLPQTSIERVIR